MDPKITTSVTQLLEKCRGGDEAALEQVLPYVYEELRNRAEGYLGSERKDHTLQPTALVHEAYLRLVRQDQQHWENRKHFLALAAISMRRILINHAEKRAALKRGGKRRRVTLFEAESPFDEQADDLLALDEALKRFEEVDPDKARIVEMRFFAGLTNEEIARSLDVSTRTVERGWRLARAWLRKEIEGSSDESQLADG
ncbi:MAG: sigma-70 family RNA polymerase sigma factor [Planctomycetota bacterium]